MSPPSDGARPVAFFERTEASRHGDFKFGCGLLSEITAGLFPAGRTLLYTAADYDALRAEVERLTKDYRVAADLAKQSQDLALQQCARAEAAEAKVSRAEIRLMRVKAFRNFCGEEAKASSNGVWSLLVERLDAALNEGDGE